jgi:hypothetical protein
MVPQPEHRTYTHPDVLGPGVEQGSQDRATTATGTGQIRALLADLGFSADAIADALAGVGITGRRGSPGGCPIARYLTANTDAIGVKVTELDITVEWPDGGSHTVRTPAPVFVFITRYDTGRYPHLIAASSLPNPVADPGTTNRTEERP